MYQKFFLLGQIKAVVFLNSDIESEECSQLIHELYADIFNDFNNATGEYEFITKDKRNENLIFVITDQILSLNHGPTKTSLDRCYTLKRYMKKDVVLINTAEVLSLKGVIPIHRIIRGNVIKEYSKLDSLPYKEIKIPFYQSGNITPDIDEYRGILEMVKKYKPYYVVTIGDIVLGGDLCSKVVPTISVPLCNGLPETMGTFKTTWNKDVNYKDNSIIESKFTYEFKPQTNKYKKDDFKIPNNKFIISIIGGRLQSEVDNNLLGILNELSEDGCFIVFVGGFELSDDGKEIYKKLNENYLNMGFQDDVLAILELVDININPKRKGGGGSGIEAMFKGKPTVSINYGDVAALVGKEFCVDTYEEMKEVVIKYKSDKKFYKIMSEKGKRIVEDLLNSEKHFSELCDNLVKNINFR